uniref:Uncharacterized protein n=1 Tax=Ciona intestinalis TaxID=7719 RepID=H2Y3D3_CIOIN
SLTDKGSHTSSTFISAICPDSPFTPHVSFPASACLARSAVIVRIVLAPQFCIKVRGIISNASAPPPGRSCGLIITFLVTCIAS